MEEHLTRQDGVARIVGERNVRLALLLHRAQEAEEELTLREGLMPVAQVPRLVGRVLPAVGEDQDLLLVESAVARRLELWEKALREHRDGRGRARAQRRDDLGATAVPLTVADRARRAAEEGREWPQGLAFTARVVARARIGSVGERDGSQAARAHAVALLSQASVLVLLRRKLHVVREQIKERAVAVLGLPGAQHDPSEPVDGPLPVFARDEGAQRVVLPARAAHSQPERTPDLGVGIVHALRPPVGQQCIAGDADVERREAADQKVHARPETRLSAAMRLGRAPQQKKRGDLVAHGRILQLSSPRPSARCRQHISEPPRPLEDPLEVQELGPLRDCIEQVLVNRAAAFLERCAAPCAEQLAHGFGFLRIEVLEQRWRDGPRAHRRLRPPLGQGLVALVHDRIQAELLAEQLGRELDESLALVRLGAPGLDRRARPDARELARREPRVLLEPADEARHLRPQDPLVRVDLVQDEVARLDP